MLAGCQTKPSGEVAARGEGFGRQRQSDQRRRRDLQTATGSGAALNEWLRAEARRIPRLEDQQKRRKRTLGWIEFQGRLISYEVVPAASNAPSCRGGTDRSHAQNA